MSHKDMVLTLVVVAQNLEGFQYKELLTALQNMDGHWAVQVRLHLLAIYTSLQGCGNEEYCYLQEELYYLTQDLILCANSVGV